MKSSIRLLKGQVSSVDLVIAISIFLLVVGLFEMTWEGAVARAQPGGDELSMRAYHVSSTLLESGGYPENWTAANVRVLGLCDERMVISKDKLSRLITLMNSDYSTAKELLGVGADDVYINVTDMSGNIVYVNGVRASGGLSPSSASFSAHSQSIVLISSATHTNNSLAILFDQSGSMIDSLPDGESKLNAARNATNDFTLYLLGTDEAALTSYTSCADIYTAQDFTSDMNDVRLAVSGMTTYTWAAIAEGINHTADEINSSADNVNRIIVVIADGEDTCSGNVSEAASYAMSQGVDMIHTIGINLTENSTGEQEMQEIASIGGGNYYRANDTDSIYENLIRAYEAGDKRVVMHIVVWR